MNFYWLNIYVWHVFCFACMCVNQTRFSVPGTTKSMGCRWVNSWRGRFLGIGHSNPDQNYNLYNLSSWSQRMGKRAEQNRHYLCKYFMFLGKGWDVVSIAWAWILWCVDLVWFDVHLDIYVSSIIFRKKNIFLGKLNRDKPGLTNILTGTTDKNKTVLPPVLGLTKD